MVVFGRVLLDVEGSEETHEIEEDSQPNHDPEQGDDIPHKLVELLLAPLRGPISLCTLLPAGYLLLAARYRDRHVVTRTLVPAALHSTLYGIDRVTYLHIRLVTVVLSHVLLEAALSSADYLLLAEQTSNQHTRLQHQHQPNQSHVAVHHPGGLRQGAEAAKETQEAHQKTDQHGTNNEADQTPRLYIREGIALGLGDTVDPHRGDSEPDYHRHGVDDEEEDADTVLENHGCVVLQGGWLVSCM